VLSELLARAVGTTTKPTQKTTTATNRPTESAERVTETIGAVEDGAVRRTRRPLIDWQTAAGEDGRTTTTVDGGTRIAGTDEASAADEEEVATAKVDEAGRRETDGRGTTTKIILGRTTAITKTTFERKEAVGGAAAVDEAGVEAGRDLPRNGRVTTTPMTTYTARVDTGRMDTTKDTDTEDIDTTVAGVTAMAEAAGGGADTAAEGVVDVAEDAVVRWPPKAVALGRLLRRNPRTTGVAVVLLHHRQMPLRLQTIRLRWSRHHRMAVATAVVAGSVVEDGAAGDEEEDEPTLSA